MMKYCGKCGEPTDNIETKICNNCFEPTHTAETVSIPVAPSPTVVQQIPVATPIHASQQEPVVNPFYHPGDSFGSYPPETEDISKAFYTAKTGEVLPIYHHSHQEEGKPKKKILPLLIGVGVVAAIFITIGLIASGIFASPVDRFVAIQRTHVIDPILAFYEDDIEDYSFDLIITASGEVSGINPGAMIVASVIEQITLELNFSGAANPLEIIYGANLNFAGADLLSAIITIDESYIGFSLPSVDDTYYIISFDDLNELASGGQGPSPFDFDITPEDMASVIERYSDILLSMVNENNLEVHRERISLFDGREEVNAQVYTVTPTEEDFRQFLLAFFEELREDDFIYQLFTLQVNPWTLHFMGYETTSDYWNSILDEAETGIDNAVENLVNANIVWRVATHRRQLILQEVSFDGIDNGTFRYEGLLSGNQRTDWFSVLGNDGDIFMAIKNEMTVSRTTAVGIAEFSIQVEDNLTNFQLLTTVSYDLDLTHSSILEIPYGFYEIDFRFSDWSGDFSFEFSLSVAEGEDGGSDHIIQLYDLDNLGFSRFAINVHSTDEPSEIAIPTGPLVNLSEMSMVEMMFALGQLAEELESAFNFFNQFQ